MANGRTQLRHEQLASSYTIPAVRFCTPRRIRWCMLVQLARPHHPMMRNVNCSQAFFFRTAIIRYASS